MAILNANPFIHFDSVNCNNVIISRMIIENIVVKKNYFISYISFVDNVVTPIANACCLPSAITACILS